MKTITATSYMLAFTLFFLFALNCKKSSDNKSNEIIQLKLDAEGLQYIQLDTGKYFIYKDSATAILDSVVVTQSLLENKYTPGVSGGLFDSYPAFNTEVFYLTLTKKDANSDSVWLEAQTPPPLCCPSLSSDNEPVQMFESNTNLVFCYPKSNCNTVELIPSLTVEGKVYQNVIEVTGDTNGTSTYYWAKDIGLIKRMEILNSGAQTYTLIRNN